MIPKWPCYIFINDDSVQETKISNQIRTDFDRGLAQSRPLNTLSIYQMQFQIYVEIKDYLDFDKWLNETLRHRSQYFLMKCPIRGEEYRFRFLDENIRFTKNVDVMEATVNLERLEDRDFR